MTSYAYPSETFGKILLEYSPGEEAGLDTITAREVVAQYAIDGQPVDKDLIDKARVEMAALMSMQSDPVVIEEMESIVDNLDYLSRSSIKIPGYKNPAQPTSLAKQIKKQRRSKAGRAAVTAGTVGGLRAKRTKRVLKAISNPDKLPGGLGDNLTVEDIDPKILKKAIKIEMEHTDDPALAQEIAVDHIAEYGEDYYKELIKMEKKLGKKKGKKKSSKKKGKKNAKKKR